MIEKCSAIILAGGFSRRFGCDKATVEWRGKRMIDYVIHSLREVACEIIVVLREDQKLDCDADAFAFDDPNSSEGPLRGILAGLKKSKNSVALVAACDSPLISPKVLGMLVDQFEPEQFALAAQWDGFLQPLVAIYSRDFISELEKHLAEGVSSPNRVLKFHDCAVLTESEIKKIDPRGLSFKNINRQDDLIALEALLSRD